MSLSGWMVIQNVAHYTIKYYLATKENYWYSQLVLFSRELCWVGKKKKKKADPKRVNTEWIHWYDNLEIANYRAGELINVCQKLGMSKGMTSVAVKEEHRRHCWW